MSRSIEVFLRHILDETRFLSNVASGLDEAAFSEDELKKRACVRSLEVIGEAVKNLPQEFRDEGDAANWRNWARVRDKLIHHYFGIDYSLVWEIVTERVPELEARVKVLLNEG